jgi:hypothetical protein
MRLLGVRPNQSELGSVAVLLRCEAGGYAGCTVLAVARPRANATEITGTAPARRRQSSFGSSSNRYANKCPFPRVKRTWRLHCEMSAFDPKRTYLPAALRRFVIEPPRPLRLFVLWRRAGAAGAREHAAMQLSNYGNKEHFYWTRLRNEWRDHRQRCSAHGVGG